MQNLLRKTNEFAFDRECEEAVEKLEKELTVYPVLRLYNLAAETELHTNVCSAGDTPAKTKR